MIKLELNTTIILIKNNKNKCYITLTNGPEAASRMSINVNYQNGNCARANAGN